MDKLIHRLPYDIVWYIYKEFIEVEQLYILFQERMNTRSSVRLEVADIRPLLPRVLANPMAVRYFSKHMVLGGEVKFPFFQEVYEKTKVQENRDFPLMKKGNSLCLSLLMYKYH